MCMYVYIYIYSIYLTYKYLIVTNHIIPRNVYGVEEKKHMYLFIFIYLVLQIKLLLLLLSFFFLLLLLLLLDALVNATTNNNITFT